MRSSLWILALMCALCVAAPAAVLAGGIRRRLLVGWAIGILGSILGIAASYFWDLPTGAAVVCALGLVLLLVGGIRRLALS